MSRARAATPAAKAPFERTAEARGRARGRSPRRRPAATKRPARPSAAPAKTPAPAAHRDAPAATTRRPGRRRARTSRQAGPAAAPRQARRAPAAAGRARGRCEPCAAPSPRSVALPARVVAVLAAPSPPGLPLLAARLLAGRGHRRRGRRGHQRRPRADRRRAHPGRRAADDPARRPSGDRAGGAGLSDGQVGQRRPELPARDADRGHRAPAGAAGRGRRHDQVAAAADGTLLAGVEVGRAAELPVLEVAASCRRAARSRATPLKQALIVGAAPEPLRPLVEEVGYDDEYGVEVTLRGGIPVRFGSGSRAAEKWAAAAAVLADPKLDVAHLSRRPGARAPGRGRRTPDISTLSRDFSEICEPSTRNRGFGAMQDSVPRRRSSIDTDATMP